MQERWEGGRHADGLVGGGGRRRTLNAVLLLGCDEHF